MKKTFTKSLLAILFIVVSVNIFAQDTFNDERFTYKITNVYKPRKVELIGVEGQQILKGKVVLPESVTYKQKSYAIASIGQDAFKSQEKMTSIELPKSVESIGDNAFSYCRDLTQVNIPRTLKRFGNRAFYFSGITSVVIPDSVKNLPEGLFFYCQKLESVTIPSELKRIDSKVFMHCNALKKITSYITTDIDKVLVGTKIFSGVKSENTTLYVPKGTKKAYEATSRWTEFSKNIVEISTGVFSAKVEKITNLELYPNIAKRGETVKVRGLASNGSIPSTTISVINSLGILISKTVSNEEYSYISAPLSAGIFIVKKEFSNGEVTTAKLIVR